jgi:AraC-like DNA-binding protein
MRETTVAASIAIDMVTQLVEGGFDAAEVCRLAGMDPAVLARPNDRIGGTTAHRLWQVAEELTGDPLIGLHVAERYRTGAISILGYVLLNCASAREALDRLCQYAALMNDGLIVDGVEAGDRVMVRLQPVKGVDNFVQHDGRHVMETMAAGIVLTLRRMTGAPFIPLLVAFRHQAAGPVAEYHRIFGTVVRFGQAEDRVVFTRREMETRILAADPILLAVFEGHAREQLAALDRLEGTGGRVARLIAAHLTGAAPSVDKVAASLAMSSRQLQRILREEGTTFQSLLDDVRRERALAQLRLPGATIAEVALLLGFSETSAFTRAFRRWTGLTPGAWATGEPPAYPPSEQA